MLKISNNNNKISIGTFEKKVDDIVIALKEQKIENNIVGVCMTRSVELLAAIFAITRSNLTFMPIGVNHPYERIKHIISNSGTKYILTNDSSFSTVYKGLEVSVINIDDNLESSASVEYRGESVFQSAFSYIYYTSGSTGKPKGLQIGEKSLANLIKGCNDLFPTTENDTWLFKTPITFDVSLAEIFTWYAYKGNISILPDGLEKDPQEIIDRIWKDNVTHINFTPSMIKFFLKYLNEENIVKIKSLKYIFSAGEALPPAIVIEFRKLNINAKLINLYGPTEATVYSTYFDTSDWDTKRNNIPIGKALPNYKALVLDENQIQCPNLVVGELYLGGIGLAKGYLNNDHLNNEKFVSDPEQPLEKLYRTGDKVRKLNDGNIEFLGRFDSQVKIRGYRIEIGEIENVILTHPDIVETAVILKDDNDHKELLAYYTSDKNLTSDQLNFHLSNFLPEYMIPSYLFQIDKMPRTTSGKIDRNILFEKGYHNKQAEFETPTTEFEKEIEKIWGKVLLLDHVSINENFFRLGGTSLKLIEINLQINALYKVNYSIETLFLNPTIKQLSSKIEADLTMNPLNELSDNIQFSI